MEIETSSDSSNSAEKQQKSEMAVSGLKRFADRLKSRTERATKRKEKPEIEKASVTIRVEKVKNFDDINRVINFMRDENIIFLDFSSMAKNPDKLKESIEKLKRASDQFNSDIVGVGESYLILAPGFAKILRQKK